MKILYSLKLYNANNFNINICYRPLKQRGRYILVPWTKKFWRNFFDLILESIYNFLCVLLYNNYILDILKLNIYFLFLIVFYFKYHELFVLFLFYFLCVFQFKWPRFWCLGQALDNKLEIIIIYNFILIQVTLQFCETLLEVVKKSSRNEYSEGLMSAFETVSLIIWNCEFNYLKLWV